MEKGAVIRYNFKKSPHTGDWRTKRPMVDRDKCLGCKLCAEYCPEAAISLEKRSKEEIENGKGEFYAAIDYVYCKGCGVCASVCPIGIEMQNED